MSEALRYKQTIEDLDSNASHIQILEKIPTGCKVLDVGCACGDIGAYLFQHKSCTVYGLEYDRECIVIANKTHAYEHIEQVDLNVLGSIPSSIPSSFDRIVFGDVLEHLNHPEEVLRRFTPLLGPKGRFVISLPNIAHGSIVAQLMMNKFTYMDYGVLDKTHMRFFTSESIASMMASVRLKILSSTRTIWDLPGLHPYLPSTMMPSPVFAHIAANPFAYVLQYVFDVAPSDQTAKSLEQHNLCQLNTFSQDEEQRIAAFGGGCHPSNDGSETVPSYRQLSFFLQVRHAGPYLKGWLKRHLPRTLWNILKEVRNYGRVLRRCIRPSDPLVVQNMYLQQLFQLPDKTNSSTDFVALSEQPVVRAYDCPKPIAFYLPQFHPFAENDAWWGRGFTEWTNVTKTVPQFVGHYQPQLPIDLGFYDLRVPEVMQRQVELAKLYGIYGFCFHYYWFSGKRLMERPLFDFLNRKELDMPFCLCWANEPWSRRWDGSENDLLIGQNLRPEDGALFLEDLLPFIKDSRYITVGERPLLIIYRPHLWEKDRVLALVKDIRELAKRHGLPGMYLITALSHDFYDDPRDWGFDAGVEFPPHLCGAVPRAQDLQFVNPRFCGSVHDMRALVDAQDYMRPSAGTTFKTVFPAWDNSARKVEQAFIFHHSSPEVYAEWLRNALCYTHTHNGPEEQFVFINAWNEWAEGAHLEPDRKYGYAFLQATANTLNGFQSPVRNSHVTS